MTYSQFVSKYNGKGVDWDGQFGNQCVDLVAQYVKEVYGIEPIYANAADWWTNFSGQVAQRFTRIQNGAVNVPKQGDILIYSKNTPGSGGYGHIEIFDKKTGAGRYQSFSQNWGGQYAHMVEHTDNYKYVLGWLTPKATTNPSTGGSKVTTAEATSLINGLTQRVFGKAIDKTGLANYVGHITSGRYTPGKAVQEIIDSPQAQAYLKNKYQTTKTVTKTVDRIVRDPADIKKIEELGRALEIAQANQGNGSSNQDISYIRQKVDQIWSFITSIFKGKE